MTMTPLQKSRVVAVVMTAGIMGLVIFAITSNEPLRFQLLSIISEEKPVIESGSATLTVGDIIYLLPMGISVFAGCAYVSQWAYMRKL